MLIFPARPLSFISSSNFPLQQFCNYTITSMDSSKLFSTTTSAADNSSLSHSTEPHKVVSNGEAEISLQEWQGWGTTSTVPSMVTQVVEDLNLLKKNVDADMVFGGNHGRLSGDFKVQEDKKHRAKYQSLGDSEQKLQFFSARQIACRVLGSRGYLCQKCWLSSSDCMCSKLITCPLWNRMRFWLYMHPKDFLRQNNTGKLLWQVFGVQAATLCLYGITEHEDMMWDALKLAGKDKVWCLYPNKNAPANSVKDSMAGLSFAHVKNHPEMADGAHSLNFILIDGTWSNSSAMFSRLKGSLYMLSFEPYQVLYVPSKLDTSNALDTVPPNLISHTCIFLVGDGKYLLPLTSKERYKVMWGEEIPCITLNTGASLMHKLRPQPSWDRTCTAAAAIGLLDELQGLSNFVSYGLDKQAKALEDAVEVLFEALTARRLRMGRSITRKQRHNSDIL